LNPESPIDVPISGFSDVQRSQSSFRKEPNSLRLDVGELELDVIDPNLVVGRHAPEGTI